MNYKDEQAITKALKKDKGMLKVCFACGHAYGLRKINNFAYICESCYREREDVWKKKKD